MKKCTRCKQTKPKTEFYSTCREKDGLNFWCKKCMSDWHRENHKTYREVYKENKLKSRYGITLKEYEELRIRQEDKCAICGGNTKRNLFVDHNHTTGKVRGLLCHNCNTGLGYFKENPIYLKLAIEYLNRSSV